MAKKKGKSKSQPVIRAAAAVFWLYLALLVWVLYGNLPAVFEDIIFVLFPMFILAKFVSMETDFKSPARRAAISLLALVSAAATLGFLYLVLIG